MQTDTMAATCTAHGTYNGREWACTRPVFTGGLCNTHRSWHLRHPSAPFRPIAERPEGGAQVTITLAPAELAALGERPSVAAGAIVRSALRRRAARERRKRNPQ